MSVNGLPILPILNSLSTLATSKRPDQKPMPADLEPSRCVGVAARITGLRKPATDDVAGCHNADDQPRSRRLEIVGYDGRDQGRPDDAEHRPEFRRQWCPLCLVASTGQADTSTLSALPNSPFG
jgi:hypothetical protein